MFIPTARNSHAKSFSKRLPIVGAFVLAASLFNMACKNESSVVSNSGNQSAPVTSSASATPPAPASPVTIASPTVTMSPSAVPTTGQVTPTTQSPGRTANLMSGSGITSPAKPALTPDPDPFPPRPTPMVVVEGGKIIQQWQAPAEAANLSNPHKDDPNGAAIGRELYMQKCVDCHGKKGQGNGYISVSLKREGKPLPPTNLASKMVQANSDGELFWKITNGRSPMPAHRVRFDDDQRWYIVSFLRTLK